MAVEDLGGGGGGGGGGPCPSVTKRFSNEDTTLIPYWYDEAGISLTKL